MTFSVIDIEQYWQYNKHIDSNNASITHTERDSKMASTKEMQTRAKAKRKSKDTTVEINTPGGVKSFNSMDDYFNQVNDSLSRSAQELLKRSSPTNVDFSLFAEPAIRTKELTIGGVKFRVDLHLDQRALSGISKLYSKDFVAMFQIFSKAGSMLLPLTRESISDAGHNYRDETVIPEDDILNRAVAALRLNSNSPVIHHISMHIAYEETKPDSGKPYYEGIDMLAIYRVWD